MPRITNSNAYKGHQECKWTITYQILLKKFFFINMWALTLTEVPVFQEKPNLPRFKKKPKNCDKIFNNIFLLDHF